MENIAEKQEEYKKLIEQGYTTKEASAKLGLSYHTCYHWNRVYHIKPQKHKRVITEEEVDLICSLYQQGLTIRELKQKFPHLKEGTIDYWLREKKITRPNGRVADINQNYFTNIDNNEKAYFLGLLFADGSVGQDKKSPNKWHITISLQESDKYILERFIKSVGCSRRLGHYVKPQKRNYYISFRSAQWAKDLAKWNCVPRKTYLNLNMPDIPENYKKAYILGFYDGDGIAAYGEQSKYVGFCGCYNFLTDLEKYLHTQVGLTHKNLYYNKTNHIYYLQYSRKEDIKRFYEFFYSPDMELFLYRKKEKIEKILGLN